MVSTVNSLYELVNGNNILVQLSVPQLMEKIINNKEGLLTDKGAISVTTGKYTGRSPKDKYIVQENSVLNKIDWGSVNQPISKKYLTDCIIKFCII